MTQESPAEELVRDALNRTAHALPPLPDLVPEALREGHRRRVRTRALAVGSAFAAVTAVTLGLSVLGPWLQSGPGTEPGAPPAAPPRASLSPPTPDASPTAPRRNGAVPSAPDPAPTAAPTSVPSPSPPPAALTAERAERLKSFRRQAAATLEALLPPAVGNVVPVDGDVFGYRADSGGTLRPVHLSVRRDPGGRPPSCPAAADPADCATFALGDGSRALALRPPVAGRPGTTVSLQYRFRGSTVTLAVSPAAPGAETRPVTVGELLGVVRSERFRELVAYAEAYGVLDGGGAP
ncbi:hypothetical protein EES43_16925 [Streptomyces sp. ADI96-02]|uniref:hypothetical protein n=1 Tax=unclassified Streptomyces TaxID=2593676 RepID=UPI000F556004|nr:hypothetical protein [Streptomyces sp. ADI96-02]RPK60648.1 hypothetical protein EES43_16925 [Streptomyces sp. ADI96-02]